MMEVQDVWDLLRRKDCQELKNVIAENPEIIHKDFGGYNLLSISVRENQFELVEILLNSGAEALPGKDIISHWANSANYDRVPCLKILSLLLKSGYSFPSPDCSKSCYDFVTFAIPKIYSYDYVDVLSGMIDLGFDPVKTEQAAKKSMIVKAVENKYDQDWKIAEKLLALGCSPDALVDDYRSPVGLSLSNRLYPFVNKLLDKGADISKIEKITLLLAGHEKLPALLRKRLLEGRSLNYVDRHGMSALHNAVSYNDSEYVSYLIENGADINLSTSSGTPLIYAIQSDYKQMAKLLVKLGADVNASLGGETALDIAMALPGFKATCTMMVKAGAKTSLELAGGNDDSVVFESIKRSVQPGEAWSEAARNTLTGLDIDKATLWNTLIRHCLDNNSSKPSKKWLKEAEMLVEAIGESSFYEKLLAWFPLVKEKRTGDIRDISDVYYDEYYVGPDHVISENNTRLLKGFIWIASRFACAEMSRSLRLLAADMYKKVYGIGMRNAKLGNAAIYSLSVMPGTVGLKEIVVLRAATKYNPALVNINRVFDKLAEASGKTPDELAELATPDYGLTGIGEYRQTLGDFTAQLNVVSVGKCELVWHGKTKTQKSVPVAIKDSHSDEIKAIKALTKDVQVGCSAHGQRIEAMYLRRKELDYETWKEQYIDHKLIGFLSRRLIWRVAHNGNTTDVLFSGDGFITHDGTVVGIPENAMLSLWHPSMSGPQEVLAWRNLLIEKEITQPFKQAHREIYLLTDAERATRDYSLRFANHILKHSQFHVLAGQRGWSQHRGGRWDGGSENSAYKTISAFDTSVSFEAEGAESYDFTDTGIYECVATGQVDFSANNKRLNLEDVDPLLFSEVMRDVDLFVGVTSIGNDPGWRDRENLYWSSSSFGDLGETAKTRKEVLQALIPKLKIAGQLQLDGNFLVVEGKLCTYKIHLGSSNILMAPNDRYLCIVAVRSNSNVMLPFEGDHTLSLILSKAAMLANDTKIKDKTILSQIHGNQL